MAATFSRSAGPQHCPARVGTGRTSRPAMMALVPTLNDLASRAEIRGRRPGVAACPGLGLGAARRPVVRRPGAVGASRADDGSLEDDRLGGVAGRGPGSRWPRCGRPPVRPRCRDDIVGTVRAARGAAAAGGRGRWRAGSAGKAIRSGARRPGPARDDPGGRRRRPGDRGDRAVDEPRARPGRRAGWTWPICRAADDLAQMVAAGLFPCPRRRPALRSPRVSDGMLRLSRPGKVTYASPNALSAYRRLGLTADLVGRELGPLTARLCASTGPARRLADAGGERPGAHARPRSRPTARSCSCGRSR